MNSHDLQHDAAAAQQIIKALALPALSNAPEPPHPIPLSRLPRLPRETSMLDTIGRVDPSGRVTNRGITDAVRWQPGDRLTMTLTPSTVVLCPAPGGLLRVPPADGILTLSAPRSASTPRLRRDGAGPHHTSG
jgi:hypothetical protein